MNRESLIVDRFKRCILFLADGARADIFDQEFKKGNLPHFAKYFAESGTYQTILTSFPSTTGPAYLPYLTGCYPGTCNIPGIRWFDRQHYDRHGWSLKSFRSYVGLETYLLNHDLKPTVKTLFEIFDRPVSILNNIYRGLSPRRNKTRYSRIWLLYYAHLTDRWSFVDGVVADKILNSLQEDNPDFIFAVFPSIDEYSHRSSVFNPRVRQAYQEIDRHVGRVIGKLKERGELEETLMILVSDHGLSDTHTHFDVGPYLEQKGMKTLFYTQIFKRNFKAVSMVSGNAMAHLYFEGADGWKTRVPFEYLSQTGVLLDELRMRPEVDLVSCTGADGFIHLLTPKGHGRFRLEGDFIEYQWDREEPLALFVEKCRDPLDGIFRMTKDQSLELTWNSPFPDVFVQLSQIFSSPRSGDIILSAAPGCDLRKRYEHPEHKASHGSLCPEHMKVPFLMNARLPKKMRRSVDVFPAILELTGR